MQEKDPVYGLNEIMESKCGEKDNVEGASSSKAESPKAKDPNNEFQAAAFVIQSWMDADGALHEILAGLTHQIETNVRSKVMELVPDMTAIEDKLQQWIDGQSVQTQAKVLTYYRLYTKYDDEVEGESDDEYGVEERVGRCYQGRCAPDYLDHVYRCRQY